MSWLNLSCPARSLASSHECDMRKGRNAPPYFRKSSIQTKTAPMNTYQSESVPSYPHIVLPLSHTIILGDSNLAQLCTTDLKNCKIRTLAEANIDRMTKWVQEKLTWTPNKCIIYCGLFNIKEGQSIDNVIDSFSILVSELKKEIQRNENMCVPPCTQHKVRSSF